MSAKKSLIRRVACIFFIASLGLAFFAVKMWRIMYEEGDFWIAEGKRIKVRNDSVAAPPNRGNIWAEDGKLLAASIPTYRLYMDFCAGGYEVVTGQGKNKKVSYQYDTLMCFLDDLCDSLATIYTNQTPRQLKEHILKGKNKKSRHYRIGDKRLSYVELKRVRKFPFVNRGRNKSGVFEEESVARQCPYGSNRMGARTIGGLYAEKGKGGRSGIEQYYDSLLKGLPGVFSYEKVAGKYRDICIVEPIDGEDVYTTLDVNIQDITEQALMKTLIKHGADHGCAVVMEVQTGKIRAMSNLKRSGDGSYSEGTNYALASQTEPGSTFKIASAIVALETGKVDTSTMIPTGNGTHNFYGKTMRDWNYNKGGYGKISLSRGIQVSSNIASALIIDELFKDNPQKFIEGLYKLGINNDLDLEIRGVARPYIKSVDDPTWSKLSLPWIAHGYEVKVPPIYILTLYNAIANNGKMMHPYLVNSVGLNGKRSVEKSPKVLNPQICSPATLGKVKQMMVDVVEHGTAQNVRTDIFQIAGKTGTAVQNVKGERKHQLTFCGFFPADEPQYSVIVVVWYPKQGVYPSAGGISGSAFKDIADQLYAQAPSFRLRRQLIPDTTRIFYPATKDGNITDLGYLLDDLEIPYTVEYDNEWGRSQVSKKDLILTGQTWKTDVVPNVVGMGAKDAVFLLENSGLVVEIQGVGTVYSQSVSPGTNLVKGRKIKLNLR